MRQSAKASKNECNSSSTDGCETVQSQSSRKMFRSNMGAVLNEIRGKSKSKKKAMRWGRRKK